MLTAIIPIRIELENLAKVYHITRGKNQDELYDAPLSYSRWPHTPKANELHNKRGDMQYKMKIYTDGHKNEKVVASGLAIFIDGRLTHQLRYKMAEKCSNNQAVQHATLKAVEKLRKMQTTQRSHRTTAFHTDSRINPEEIANTRKYQNLVESIRKVIRTLEADEWIVIFTCVKVHDNNSGNELADLLAK